MFGSLRMTNRTFAVAPKRGARAARARRGTAFAYTLSEPARVVLTIERKAAGRRSSRRWVRAGSFTQDGAAGANNKRWAGNIGTKSLKPGVYRASIVATDAAGNKSAARRLSFRSCGGSSAGGERAAPVSYAGVSSDSRAGRAKRRPALSPEVL